MKLLSCVIGLLLLSCGVVEAGDLGVKPGGSAHIVSKSNGCLKYIKDGDGVVRETCQSPKEVVIQYDDFLKMLASKEHSDKLLHQCAAERAILLKLKDEQGKTISIQADQVKGLIETAETQERLGATEAQINEALQKQLAKVTQDLENEKPKKYWWAGGGFGVGVAVGVIIMMVVN